MPKPAIEVENLRQFQRACKAADAEAARELRRAIKDAGAPIVTKAAQYAGAARRTGTLQAGYAVRAAGPVGKVVSRAPYGGGAEWGRLGKWAGFLRYPAGLPGGKGRFAWRAVEAEQATIIEILNRRLTDVIHLAGFARGEG